jgi:hypothetical protein
MLHQQLQRDHDTPINVDLLLLVREQQRHTCWLRLIAVALVLIVTFQFAGMYLIWLGMGH